MFRHLLHADWSSHPEKRWMATATRTACGWEVDSPRLVPDAEKFLDEWLFGRPSVLAGFDFPIGIPDQYAKKTSFRNFRDALSRLGEGEWAQFFVVASGPEQISIQRPFYPANSLGQPRHPQLVAGLQVENIDHLRRLCERKTASRRAACPLFWTVGANQVGKAAIDGWQNVIRPALARGARLWPFDGTLEELSKSSSCVICETYPQEAYSHLNVKFSSRREDGKSSQQGRQRVALSVLEWADRHNVKFSADARNMIAEGCDSSRFGEDQFDAVMGLLGMIDALDADEPNLPPEACLQWEGWIIGQSVVAVGSVP
jgi:Protein of unknown function (DUF429)